MGIINRALVVTGTPGEQQSGTARRNLEQIETKNRALLARWISGIVQRSHCVLVVDGLFIKCVE
jgi:hypothetical protein